MRALAAIGAAVAAVAATTLIVGPGDGTPHAVGTPTVAQQGHLVAQGSFGGPPPANPAPGDVLFTGPGHWSGSPTGFAYAWKDCDSGGANCTTAAGSPTNTTRYQIVSGDTGFTIRVAVTASYSGHPDSTVLSQPTAVVSDFPLSVSGNGRFLQTASGVPFLMVGDSPWTVLGNSDRTHADAYFSDRASHGFNTLLLSLFCDVYLGCSDAKTYDGVAAFTSGTSVANYDFSTPNSTYFSRVHQYLTDAQAAGLVVELDPADTGGCNTTTSWFQALLNNGNGTLSTGTKDYQFGQYLGTTFKDLHNIIWMSGNDFQCIETTADKNDALAVAKGIANTDPAALQSLEADFCTSSVAWDCSSDSLFDTAGVATGWASTANVNSTYSYAPTYAQVRTAYGESSTQPAIMGEANYEGEKNETPGTDGCITVANCRLQEWWSMTSGAAGQVYGGPSDRFSNSTTIGSIDTTGVAQLQIQTSLLSTLDWKDLVPDTNGAGHFITSGGGTCPTTGSFVGVTCVTAAETADQLLGLIYDPQGNTITVALSKMAAGKNTTARWYDPTNGTFSSISGSPFADTGTHSFATPGNNNAGDSDWVLLLQAS